MDGIMGVAGQLIACAKVLFLRGQKANMQQWKMAGTEGNVAPYDGSSAKSWLGTAFCIVISSYNQETNLP